MKPRPLRASVYAAPGAASRPPRYATPATLAAPSAAAPTRWPSPARLNCQVRSSAAPCSGGAGMARCGTPAHRVSHQVCHWAGGHRSALLVTLHQTTSKPGSQAGFQAGPASRPPRMPCCGCCALQCGDKSGGAALCVQHDTPWMQAGVRLIIHGTAAQGQTLVGTATRGLARADLRARGALQRREAVQQLAVRADLRLAAEAHERGHHIALVHKRALACVRQRVGAYVQVGRQLLGGDHAAARLDVLAHLGRSAAAPNPRSCEPARNTLRTTPREHLAFCKVRCDKPRISIAYRATPCYPSKRAACEATRMLATAVMEVRQAHHLPPPLLVVGIRVAVAKHCAQHHTPSVAGPAALTHAHAGARPSDCRNCNQQPQVLATSSDTRPDKAGKALWPGIPQGLLLRVPPPPPPMPVVATARAAGPALVRQGCAAHRTRRCPPGSCSPRRAPGARAGAPGSAGSSSRTGRTG